MIDKRIWICAAILLLAATTGTAAALEDIEQLGKSIFFDESLSIKENQACASCHDPVVGWTGPDSIVNAHEAIYEGSIKARFGDRKPPSAAYATQSPILDYKMKGGEALFTGGNFWDGRATGEKLGNPAADQAQGPFLNSAEQAFTDSTCVVYRVCEAEYDPVSFETVYGHDACNINWPANIETVCETEGSMVDLQPGPRAKSDTAYDNIALSIAAYEASPEVNAFTSKWDYSRKDMSTVKLSKEERDNFALFQSKGKCAGCHITRGAKPLLTDYTFDNLGIPKNPENPAEIDPNFIDLGLGKFLDTREEYRKFAIDNMGKHKVPTLRNVDLRPSDDFVKAYGHNGYFKSLKGIVKFYNTRDTLPKCEELETPIMKATEAQALDNNCWPAAEVPQNVNMDELGDLGLTDEEENAIVAFMRTLSDGYEP